MILLGYLPGPPVRGFHGAFEADYGDYENEGEALDRVVPAYAYGRLLPFSCPKCGEAVDFSLPGRRACYRDRRQGVDERGRFVQRDNHFCPSCGWRFRLGARGMDYEGPFYGQKVFPSRVERAGGEAVVRDRPGFFGRFLARFRHGVALVGAGAVSVIPKRVQTNLQKPPVRKLDAYGARDQAARVSAKPLVSPTGRPVAPTIDQKGAKDVLVRRASPAGGDIAAKGRARDAKARALASGKRAIASGERALASKKPKARALGQAAVSAGRGALSAGQAVVVGVWESSPMPGMKMLTADAAEVRLALNATARADAAAKAADDALNEKIDEKNADANADFFKQLEEFLKTPEPGGGDAGGGGGGGFGGGGSGGGGGEGAPEPPPEDVYVEEREPTFMEDGGYQGDMYIDEGGEEPPDEFVDADPEFVEDDAEVLERIEGRR